MKSIDVTGVRVLVGCVPRGAAAEAGLLARLLSGVEQAAGRPVMRLALEHDRFGRPMLVDPDTGREQDLTVSFARATTRSWAALGRSCRIGIDIVAQGEFEPPYPYDRVFADAELALVRPLTDGRRADGAALLWSVKEAAVKAIGCAFHGLDYRDVRVQGCVANGDALCVHVSAREAIMRAWAARDGASWLAVAVAGGAHVQPHLARGTLHHAPRTSHLAPCTFQLT